MVDNGAYGIIENKDEHQKMKIRKTKNNKVLLTTLLVGLLAVAGVAAYIYLRPSEVESDQSVNYDEATEEQIQAGKDTAEQQPSTSDDDATESPDGQADTPLQSLPAPVETAGDIHLTVVSQSDNTLTIRTLIQGVAHGGSCELRLSRLGAPTVTRTAGTQLTASNSTCQGFDIDTSTMQKGDYNLNVTYRKDDVSKSASQKITIR